MKNIIAIAFMATAISVHAKTVEEQVKFCAVINNDIARLACYDAIVNDQRKAEDANAQVSSTRKWKSSVNVNPIDDTKAVLLTLVSDKGKSSWGTPVRLEIQCLRQKTTLVVHWQDYLGNEAKVTTRFGVEVPRTEQWILSEDSQATFYPGDTPALLRQMMTSDQAVFQASPYFEDPIVAVFDITGMAEAIKPIRASCFW